MSFSFAYPDITRINLLIFNIYKCMYIVQYTVLGATFSVPSLQFGNIIFCPCRYLCDIFMRRMVFTAKHIAANYSPQYRANKGIIQFFFHFHWNTLFVVVVVVLNIDQNMLHIANLLILWKQWIDSVHWEFQSQATKQPSKRTNIWIIYHSMRTH